MKPRKFPWLAVIVALLLVALLAVACGGGEEEAAETTAGETTTEEETMAEGGEAEAFNLKFVTLDDDDILIALDGMIAAWKAATPAYANVTVEIDAVPFAQLFPKIETAVAAGADFDAFLADGPDMKHYAYNNAIIPLQDYYTADEIAEYLPQSVEEGSFNGVFYGPAMMQSCSLMFYNEDYTSEAGLNPPQVATGWTMDEAWDAWQKTTVDNTGDGSPDIWGLRWGQGTWQGDYEHGILRRSAGVKGSPTYEGMGPDAITFVGYLDTPEAIASYEVYRAWHIGDRAVSPREPIPDIFYGARQSAFYVSPDNAIAAINRLYPDGSFKYGVTGIPYFENGSQVCHTGSWHLGVSPVSQHQEAAISMVKFFAGAEGSKIWYEAVNQLPARFDLLNSLPEYNEYPQQLFAQGLQEFGIPRIQTPCYTEYQQIHAELLQNISQGTDVNVEQLVKEAASNMEQACAKYKGWENQ